MSDEAEVVSGVPQGTVIGPLLFLVYINDLPEVTTSNVKLFADDCLIYRPIKSSRDIEQLQHDLQSLEKWELDWQMAFHPAKCTVIHVSKKRRPIKAQYQLHGHILEAVPSGKYLGISISEDLSWHDHINTTTAKATKMQKDSGGRELYQPQDEEQGKLIFEEEKESGRGRSALALTQLDGLKYGEQPTRSSTATKVTSFHGQTQQKTVIQQESTSYNNHQTSLNNYSISFQQPTLPAQSYFPASSFDKHEDINRLANQPSCSDTNELLLPNNPFTSTGLFVNQQPYSSTSQFVNQQACSATNQFVNNPSCSATSQFVNKPSCLSTSQFVNQQECSATNQFVNQPSCSATNQFVNKPSCSSTSQFVNQPSCSSTSIGSNSARKNSHTPISRSVKLTSAPDTPHQMGHKLRLKISKGTRVDPPPPPDVIVIDDDDNESDKLHLVTIPESARVTVPQSAKESHSSAQSTLKFPEHFIPKMHLLNVRDDGPEQPFVDIRQYNNASRQVRERREVVTQETFNTALSTAKLATDFQNSTPGTSHPVQETRMNVSDIGINMRMGDNMTQEEIMRILELITPDEMMNVDLTGLDFDMEDDEKLPKKVKKYTDHQPHKVVCGEKSAVVDILNHKDKLTKGIHGVLCDTIEPSGMLTYSEGDYEVLKALGAGSYGKVDLCKDRASERVFVKKTVHEKFSINEVLIMLYLDHINITKLYGYIHREGMPEILMEYVGINLVHFVITKPEVMTEENIRSLSKQGLSALEYLDNHEIKHMDLKPENLCVQEDKTLTLKLMDFGSAKTALDKMEYVGLTAEYMAPEIGKAFLETFRPNLFKADSSNFPITGKADVFAFALVIMFMYQKTHVLMHFFTQGKSSYKEVPDPNKLRLNIIVANARKPDMVKNYMITDKCGTDMKILLEGMLEGCPLQRLSAREVLCKMEAMEKGDVYQQPMSPLDLLRSHSICDKAPPTMFRRTTSIKSDVSMDIMSPNSPGPVRHIAAKRWHRKRSQMPYDHGGERSCEDNKNNEAFKGIQVAENIKGNVPNFQVI
ncbi:hypothetical protein FSP39_014351 [Pinctada imbricata]|uniref:Protein kinase domain-containing protein n=1 Tax=Pinctada imbricata TaxID=66713 RepID=A0AA89C6U5_PINIB|nr:hypothetical protein FSP39_014351 [Pinctada imbricata]